MQKHYRWYGNIHQLIKFEAVKSLTFQIVVTASGCNLSLCLIMHYHAMKTYEEQS
jgi:hypothetical protein